MRTLQEKLDAVAKELDVVMADLLNELGLDEGGK
jgi:hypothetical protein